MRLPSLTVVIVSITACSGASQSTTRESRSVADTLPSSNAALGRDAQVQLDTALRIARAYSLWRDTVTWGAVERDVRALAAGGQTAADVYPAIRLLLRRLGDNHSFVMPPDASRANATGGAQNRRPHVRLEQDSIGYVSVFGYSGSDRAAAHQYAKALQDSLASVMRRGARCRWIVDLRQNTGGNMWPMLAGLRPLLGDGDLGSFVGGAGAVHHWRANAMIDIKPARSLAHLDSAWVAVLTGPRTASSGEAVTTAFRGRPHTRSFGQPTAGLSTANGTYRLPDGGMILLTVSVYADRTGARTGHKMEPDVLLLADGAGDSTMAAAAEWLRRSPGCS